MNFKTFRNISSNYLIVLLLICFNTSTIELLATTKTWDGGGSDGSAQLSLFSLPIVALRDSTICEGPSVLFDAGNLGSTYAWSDDAFGFAQKFNAQNSGVYTVTVTNTNHCSASSSATLTVNAIPTIAMVDQALCEGNATIFDAENPGATFLWSGEGSGTEQTCPASASGIYNVKVTSANNCFASASAELVVNTIPVIALANQEICTGTIATFDAGNTGSSFIWSGASSSSNQSINVTAAGTYTVTVTSPENCSNSASAKLVVNPLPVVSLGADQKLCEGSTVTLISDIDAASYLWNTTATSKSIVVSKEGIYTLSILDSKGCTGSSSTTLTLVPVPKIDLEPYTELCAGQSTIIDSKLNSGKLFWSTGETTSFINVSVCDTILLTAFFDASCPAVDSTIVKVLPYPISGLQNDTTLCFTDNSLDLNAGIAEAYMWFNGTNSSSITVDAPGSYNVTLTNGKNCSITDHVKIKELCITKVFVPNAFTPFNEDDNNDIFLAKGTNVSDFHMMIFNRWGELMFESFDINHGWDATYKGHEVQIDVYVWKLDWRGNEQGDKYAKNQKLGSVTVIR